MVLTLTEVLEKLDISQEELEILVFKEILKPIEFKYRTRHWKFYPEDIDQILDTMSYHKNNLKASEIEREWR